MVDDAQASLLVHDQIERMEIAVTEYARARRQVGGNVIQLGFQLGGLPVRQAFFTITSKIVLEKEIQFPRELRFVKSQTTGNRIALKRLRRRCLNAGDDFNRLFNQR